MEFKEKAKIRMEHWLPTVGATGKTTTSSSKS